MMEDRMPASFEELNAMIFQTPRCGHFQVVTKSARKVKKHRKAQRLARRKNRK